MIRQTGQDTSQKHTNRKGHITETYKQDRTHQRNIQTGQDTSQKHTNRTGLITETCKQDRAHHRNIQTGHDTSQKHTNRTGHITETYKYYVMDLTPLSLAPNVTSISSLHFQMRDTQYSVLHHKILQTQTIHKHVSRVQ